MTTVTAADQVNLLTRLPPACPAYPHQMESGYVIFFNDNNWTSQNQSISINDYRPNKRHTLASWVFDETTFIAFNLPVGTVVTLMDNVQAVPDGQPVADLSDCGKCVDLVGTGKTESADICPVGMNDCVSAFFWRKVDLSLGAIELFEDLDFRGNRITLFLCEWASGVVHDFSRWWMQDQATSVKWCTLQDRQTATLYENSDGSGNQFNDIQGWGNIKSIHQLGDFRFNDMASAFRWDPINPVKEIIAPFTINSGDGAGSTGLTSVVTGTNRSSLAQPVTLQLNNSTAQTVTVTTTDTHVVGISSTFSLEATTGVVGVASSKTAWSVTLNYNYTHTDTKSTSTTSTVALSITQVVNAPPNTSYKATLLVNIGQIPPTVYHTTAQRWYDVPMTGGVADPSNQDWYKRTEPVTVTVAGSLASNTAVDIEATPLTIT
jgi:hypothetical protein